MNGDMEAGPGGTGVVPTNWSIVQNTPDNCASPPALCPGPSYVINNPSPDAGRWVRFFRGGGWNERFGQFFCTPLIAGQTYTLEFWASLSDLNSSANANNTGIDFGFSNGLPAGTGAGTNNASSVALNSPEVWQFVSFTFVASGNYDFLSFAKNTTDTQNATYIDGVTLIGAVPSAPILPADTTLCTGQNLLLDVSSFTGPYTWQDGSTNATFNVTTAGTYYVDLGPAGGCLLTDTIVVTFTGAAAINLGNDTTLCTGDVLLLDASAAPGPYTWQDGSTNATFNVVTAGQYYVTVGSGSCVGTDTINVAYTAPPIFSLGQDTTLCNGQNLLLDVSAVLGTYLWSDGSTAATLNVNTTGTYFVEITTGSCVGYDTIVVNFTPNAAVNLGNDTTLCAGDILILDASAAPGPYVWQDGSTNTTFNVNVAGQYFVTAGSGACLAMDTINVAYTPIPSFNLGADTTLCNGQNLLLDVSAVLGTYLWSDGSTANTLNVSTAGTYFVEITNGSCVGYDTIIVNFTPTATINLGNDTTLCAGSVLLLDASSAPAPYLWQDGSTASTFLVNVTGMYFVDVGSGACSGADTINVTFASTISVNLGNDTTLCNGQNLLLDVSAVTGAYLWNDGSTASTSNVNTAGTYFVEITNGSCLGFDTIVVAFLAPSTINLGNDTTLCLGDNLLLDATSVPGPYLWNNGSTNATLNVVNTGQYYIQIGANGCTSSDTINVTFQPYPTPNLGADLVICQGNNVTLDPQSIPGPYLWQDGSVNGTLQTNLPGTYWVQVGQLCLATDTLVISDVNLSLNISVTDSVGCDSVFSQFSSTAVTNGAGVQTWFWDFGDGTTSTQANPSHLYSASGSYTVSLTATTIEGCTITLANTNWISVYSSPNASFIFSPQMPTVENTEVQFTDLSTGALTWTWNFGNGLGGSSSQSPSFTFPTLANYSYIVDLQITDANGCTDVTQQIITIQDVIIYYVPNAFTPDGDAYNEEFSPVFTSGIDPYNFHMTIFNRWGEIVFESFNKDIGWDGSYGDGGLVQDGIYIWKLEFKETMSDKKHERYGHVTILK
jgi:gliding motility-associated-like protein